MIQAGKQRRVFEAALRATIEGGMRVLDIGTSRRFAKELYSYQSLFAGKRYVAAGYNPKMSFGELNCDEHQDIQTLTYEDGAFDAVLCIEVLEHVEDPFKAASEIVRVLRPGGRLLVTVPFLLGFHGKGGVSASHDEYPDYWRFTHQGLQKLFAGKLTALNIQPVDGPIEMRLKYMRLERWVDRWPLRNMLDAIDRPAIGRSTTRHLLLGTK